MLLLEVPAGNAAKATCFATSKGDIWDPHLASAIKSALLTRSVVHNIL